MNFYLEYRLQLKDEIFFSGWAKSSDIYISGSDVEVQSYQRPDVDPHRNFGFCFTIDKEDLEKSTLHLDDQDIILTNLEVTSKAVSLKFKFRNNFRIFLSKSKAALTKLIKYKFIIHPLKLLDEVKFTLNTDNWGTSFLNTTKWINNKSDKNENFILAVPIYNGIDFLENCLASVDKYCPDNFEVYLLDDCSNDVTTKKIISKYLEKNKHWIHIRNEVNLGFLKNCNQIFKIAVSRNRNIVLLNSDTVIYQNSLSNLAQAVMQTNGLVCPLTNACSYASFPNPSKENKAPLDDSLIKAINSTNSAKAIRVPVSVGFCLGMTCEALKDLRSFDTIFGKGYGEEVEMSLRANKKNIFSYIYTGSYVAHEHGSSFTPEEKQSLNQKNSSIINNIYPWFNSLIQSFRSYNLLEREYFLTAIRAIIESDKYIDVCVNHHFGGGATKYLEDQAFLFNTQTLSISYVSENSVNVSLYLNGYMNSLSVNMSEVMLSRVIADIDSSNKVKNYKVNHLMTMLEHKKIGFHSRFKAISNKKSYLWHDFYAICPNYTLVDNNDNKFCGVPNSDSNKCTSCWKKGNYSSKFDVKNIDEYRAKMTKEMMIDEFDNIFFSESSRKIVKSVKEFKDIKTELIPHKCEIPRQEKLDQISIEKIDRINRKSKKYSKKILLLGGLNQPKGSDVIFDLCDPMLSANACFIHLGDIENKRVFFKNNYLSYGRYDLKNLKSILESLEIDSGFIPSIWPETFNYVADELSMLDIPFTAFNIGAVEDRYKDDKNVSIVNLDLLNNNVYSLVNNLVSHN